MITYSDIVKNRNTVTNFVDINPWVFKHIDPSKIVENDIHVCINNLPAEFDIYSKIGFQTIFTHGDGSCLIHSIILAFSPIYNKLPLEDKSNLAKMFRKTQFIYHTKKEINNIHLVASDLFLDDRHADEMAKWLQIVIVMFDLNMAKITKYHEGINSPSLHVIGLDKETSDNTPVIFIHGSGAHFEAMCYQRKTVLSLKEARNIKELSESLTV